MKKLVLLTLCITLLLTGCGQAAGRLLRRKRTPFPR